MRRRPARWRSYRTWPSTSRRPRTPWRFWKRLDWRGAGLGAFNRPEHPQENALSKFGNSTMANPADLSPTFPFLVAPESNKTEIKEAIQQIWNVRVLNVNTMNRKGKVKRTRMGTGRRPDQKRAVVTLAAGESIEIFETRGP